DDGVEIDVTAMTLRAKGGFERFERPREEAGAPVVGDDRAHFAGELAEISGEKPLVLPVEAGRLHEALAVEIGARADLDAIDMLGKDEARASLVDRRAVRFDHCSDVLPIWMVVDVIFGRAECSAIELQDVASRAAVEEGERLLGTIEGKGRRDRQPVLGQQRLAEPAIVLQPVAEFAAADDLEAVAPQTVLKRATLLGHILEQQESVGAGLSNPTEIGAPIGAARDPAGERALASLLTNMDADLVTLRHQAEIERPEIAGIADAEKSHRILLTLMALRDCVGGLPCPRNGGAAGRLRRCGASLAVGASPTHPAFQQRLWQGA